MDPDLKIWKNCYQLDPGSAENRFVVSSFVFLDPNSHYLDPDPNFLKIRYLYPTHEKNVDPEEPESGSYDSKSTVIMSVCIFNSLCFVLLPGSK